jgi:hypothetical protein
MTANMTFRHRLTWLAFLALMGFQTTVLFGGTVGLHTGDADPTTEGFSVVGLGSGAAVNDGLPAWQFSSTGAFLHYYDQLSPAEALLGSTLGWIAEGNIRLTSLESGQTAAFMNIDFGGRRFDLNLYVVGETLHARLNTAIVAGQAQGQDITVAGSATAYHLYEMRYDATSQLASLYIDSNVAYSGYGGHTDSVTGRGLWLGAAGQPVSFNMAELSVTDAPEPFTGLLVGLGLVGVAAFRRRRAA